MFNPARLDLARKRARLSARVLADKAGISPVTLSRVLNGKQRPDEQTISALAKALGYPITFFDLPEVDEIDASVASFRSMKAMTALERDAALASGMIAYELIDMAKRAFELPMPDLLDLGHDCRDPEDAARHLRKYWGIGERPIGHMIKLLEFKGVRVFSLSENTRNVDAFSCWRKDEPYVFLNTFKTPERTRFDAAHELGHLILHKHGGPNQRSAEAEADKFASAFLMPAADVMSIIPRVTGLSQLISAKARWGVSLAALTYRTYKLGLITEWQYRNMFINMDRTREINGIEREYSDIWKKLLQEMWRDGLSKERIARELHVPQYEIDNLVFGLTPIVHAPEPGRRSLHVVK